MASFRLIWLFCCVIASVQTSENGERNELLPLPPGYVILGSKYLKPNSIYQVAVTLPKSSEDVVLVKALIAHNKANIALGSVLADSHETVDIRLKVPSSVEKGQYSLRVEGYTESTNALLFRQHRVLQYVPNFLTILVQTNRAVYNIGMEVKIRVILLQMDMKPYTEPVSIFIKEPNGFIMRRWISKHSNNGVISIVYQLPALPRAGKWLIVVQAHSQVHTYPIYVHQYFLTQFELMVWTPVQVLHTEPSIEGNVFTAFNPEKVGLANVTVRTSAKINNGPFEIIEETHPEWVPGLTFSVALPDIEEKMGRLIGLLVRIEIIVFEQFIGETRTGYSETKIIENKIKVRLLGQPNPTFRPGMPLPIYIAVSYDDNHRLSTEELEQSSLEVLMTVTTSSGQSRSLPSIVVPVKDTKSNSGLDYNQWLEKQYTESVFHRYRTKGVFSTQISVPEDAQEFRLTARYSDADRQTQTTIIASPVATRDNQYIMLVPSEERVSLGSFAIFQLKSNFYFEDFNYVVASKGLILFTGTEKRLHPGHKTTSSFSVPVSPDMVPSFTVLVYVTSAENDLLCHSVTMPVDGFSRYKMNLTLVQRKDPTKTTVHMYTLTEPGSFIGFSLLRTIQYNFQAWNELSPSSVLKALHRLEPSYQNRAPNVTWVDRDGQRPDVTEYFPAINSGLDAWAILDQAGVLAFTNSNIVFSEGSFEDVGTCLSTGVECRNIEEDGDYETEQELFRVFRRNTYHDFYNWLDGDFAWFDVPITEDGEVMSDQLLPLSNEAWFLNAFSVHPEYGFTMLEDIIFYDGTPPFYIAIECATKIRRGETVGVRIWVVNNLAEDIMAIMLLPSSKDYFFVEVDDHGLVKHYDPKLSSADHQHVIFIHPNGLAEVPVAIAPQIDQGTISVQVIVLSQMARQEQTVDIEILPEGVPMFRHLSLLLDLQNQANVLRFLDIPVEESPVIPYSKLRRYVYGSPKATVTVTGDVFGPVLLPDAVNYVDMFKRGMTGLELHLFNMGATLWSLHYVRLTNKLTSQGARQSLTAANVHMAGLTEYYNSDGSFRLFAASDSNLWGTAWVLRVFGQTYLQDWENDIYIDPQLVQRCVDWILTNQRSDGSFPNNGGIPVRENSGHKDVPMTAHLLVALESVVDFLPSASRLSVSSAKLRAMRYLERQLPSLTSAYELALVTYALTLGNYPAREEAFGKLYKIKQETDEYIYWSNQDLEDYVIQYENQKPFLQPKNRTASNGQAVEATAYALLILLHREGVTVVSHKIVTWLNTMRLSDAGFVGSFDTLVTMQALTEYAFRARIADISDMEVVVNPSASGGKVHSPRFDSEHLLEVHQFPLESVWGHVNIFAKGVGQAVVQLHVEYGIDWEELKDYPREKYYQLSVREYYSQFRNKSHVTIEACFRWTGNDPQSSSLTILEIETPSGYGIIQGDVNNLLNTPGYMMVKDIEVYQTKVAWFFDYVPTTLTCFSYEVRRWYPVANLTQKRTAVIYESHAPEIFEYELIDATPLYVLDVCEVCASYKCPYCPQYSGCPKFHETVALFAISWFAVLFTWAI